MTVTTCRLLILSTALAALLPSCSSPPKVRGLPKNLPVINLRDSPATPPHSMARHDYPFDANGNYVTAWASQGGDKAGESGSGDYESWQSSHGGSVSRKQPSPVKKVSSSSSTKTTAKKTSSGSSGTKSGSASKTVASSKSKSTGSTSSKPKTTASTSSKPKSSGGGGSYTIQKGDTLSAIARKHNTTVAKIKSANGMSGDFLREGKPLKIPK